VRQQTKSSLYAALIVLGLCLFQIANVQAIGVYNATKVIGQLTGGNPDFTTRASGTTSSALNYPAGTAIDTIHHRLFITDAGNNRVIIHNLSSTNDIIDYTADNVLGQAGFGTSTGIVTQNGLNGPYIGIAYDGVNNRLFVADNFSSRVMVYNLSGGITDGMNASNELGQPNYLSSGGSAAQNGLNGPWGITLNAAGNRLFVADHANNRVVVYNVAPGTISDGMNASNVLGQAGFGTNSTGNGQNGLNGPESIAYDDNAQLLLVGDSGNRRIMAYDLSGGITDGMNAANVIGQANFSGSSPSLSRNGLGTNILGMGYDTATDNLYVSDRSNNRILIYNLHNGVTNGMNAATVIGQPDFTTADPCGSSPASNSLCFSEGNITVDPTRNRIYVPDTSNYRILAYDFALMPTIPTTGTLNTPFNALGGSQTQGTPTYTLASGSLPNGLSLNTTTGAITGTPTQAGTFGFVLGLSDDIGIAGSFATQQAYSITIPAASSGSGTSSGSSPVGVPNTGLPAASPIMPIGSALAGLSLLVVLAYRRRRNRVNGTL
jgi:DNA-binding beta-propeller fold protein YncE